MHKCSSHTTPPPLLAMASDWSKVQSLESPSCCLLVSSKTEIDLYLMDSGWIVNTTIVLPSIAKPPWHHLPAICLKTITLLRYCSIAFMLHTTALKSFYYSTVLHVYTLGMVVETLMVSGRWRRCNEVWDRTRLADSASATRGANARRVRCRMLQ